MPYCPKCDMEFVEGITVCSDCGGPLVESEEAAKALKAQEEQASQQQEWDTDPGATQVDQIEKLGRSYSAIYKKKSQKYEDLKSSASAFIMVGVVLLVFSLLCWLKIINLPMEGVSKLLFQTVLTVMGIGAVAVAASSANAAKGMSSQIEEENQNTAELIGWFTEAFTADAIDQKILEENGELSPEEQSLKRYEYIQDLLTTHKDLPDEAFVESISEDIYEKMFDN